jgi:hypothetical protein
MTRVLVGSRSLSEGFAGPGTRSHRWDLAVIAVVTGLIVAAPASLGAQGTPDSTTLGRGSMGVKSKPRVHEGVLPPGAIGMSIDLQMLNQQLDLDMLVFPVNPDVAEASPICASTGSGVTEHCKVLGPDLRSSNGRFWVRVVVAAGQGNSSYVLTGRPLAGPILGNSSVTAEDAVSLALGVPATGGFGQEGAPDRLEVVHPYRLDLGQVPRGRPLVASLTSGPENVRLRFGVFDSAGVELSRSNAGSTFEERPLPPALQGVAYVAVWLDSVPDIRLRPTYTLSVADPSTLIPLELTPKGTVVSGTGAREFSLKVPRGQLAIVTLEGVRSDLTIMRGDGTAIPTQSLLGGEQHIAWIGDPIASASSVLRPLHGLDSLRIKIQPNGKTGAYGTPDDWTLGLRAPVGPGPFLIQMRYDAVEGWDDWWSGTMVRKAGRLSAGEVRLLRLPAPQDNNPKQDSPRASAGRGSTFARLADGNDAFDLAVTTRTGEVLDIGDGTVRWDWPAAASELYLVIFPTPGRGAPAGSYVVELSRSFTASNWKN